MAQVAPEPPKFDVNTGQPIQPAAKFDVNTGQPIQPAAKFDVNTGQPIQPMQPAAPVPMQMMQPGMQPGMMQPGVMQPGMMQPGGVSMNASGQLVDSTGRPVVMDGGGRVWSAPFGKIMAHNLDGCYLFGGLPPTVLGIEKITSEGEDIYWATGCAMGPGIIPFSDKYNRIPNTNSFKEDCCQETHKYREQNGRIHYTTSCFTVLCSTIDGIPARE